MWAPLLHRVAAAGFRPSHRRLRSALGNPEAAQRRALRRILGFLAPSEQARIADLGASTSYEEFANRLPVASYADVENRILRQRAFPDLPILAPGPVRFLPTSGSTAARKWIPATAAFGRELDAAAGAWIVDLARCHPGLLDGRHYWSLSWLPDELRGSGASTDDLDLLPPLRRWALRHTMAVPDAIAHLSTSAASRLATVVYLTACRDLRLVSVWSPTFLLSLLAEMDRAREAIAAVLECGDWARGWDEGMGAPPSASAPRDLRAAQILREAPDPINAASLRLLWPRLCLLSAWDSSTSASFADLLRERLPHAPLQGKGLWATEGVVTIPFEGDHPAAITSHFLEFRCLHTGQVHPVWELRSGQEVQPLLTTSGGLLRYALDDRMTVTESMHETPCLRFEGRLGGVDLVGEKMDARLADALLREVERELPLRALCLLAITPTDAPPSYILLAEPRESSVDVSVEHAGAIVEHILRRIHHYALARDSAQLALAGAVIRDDAREWYASLCGSSARVQGACKIESVVCVSDPVAVDSILACAGAESVSLVQGAEGRCV